MDNTNYILKETLPIEQNFKALKEKGMDFIREFSGTGWSNLNASDPGITILEQVCFALSELGYCGDFPVGDLLADPDGTLNTDNQFYLPEEILTSSPVTVKDYIKFIVDEVSAVKNAVIIPANITGLKVYEVYLCIDETLFNNDPNAENKLKDKVLDNKELICYDVFFKLNKCRNLGEVFLLPKCCDEITVEISGTVLLEQENYLQPAILKLETWWQDYIFPAAKAFSYDSLVGEDLRTEEIINGPKLKNGWFTDESLGEKKQFINTIDLNQFLNTVPGISSASISGFRITGDTNDIQDATENKNLLTEIHAGKTQLFLLDLSKSVKNGSLTISCKNSELDKPKLMSFLDSHTIVSTTSLESHIDPAITKDTGQSLPKVKYRDISNYYSIQNTFPEIYAAGADSVTTNSAEYQMAQSRQLKAYLTLFDQVLANQFAQLANIGKLFSFTNGDSGSPTDIKKFYSRQSRLENNHDIYPAPYKIFSPTYFYQSLYDVPHIKPLLKGNDTFSFDTELVSAREQEQKAWEAYKLDPYNPYIRGLMSYMEYESTNLIRRNDILDHLLARYGESPLLIDTIIKGSTYSGDSAKDKVIFKSLLLQNLGYLSYFRSKAADYLITKIDHKLPTLPRQLEDLFPYSYTTDFIVNSHLIDKAEKITENDIARFSAVELKLSLLFGLKQLYCDFISENWSKEEEKHNIQIAMWMIQQRKGLIFMESGILWHFMNDEKVIEINRALDEIVPANGVILMLPAFIPLFNTITFQDRLKLFLESFLPLTVPYQYCLISPETLPDIITAYSNWVNSINFESGSSQKENSTRLFDLLNTDTIQYHRKNES